MNTDLIPPPRYDSAIPFWYGRLFRSLFMGGFEGSSHRRRDGRQLDLVAATGARRPVRSRITGWPPPVASRDGPELIERFLQFLASEPEMQCNFISYHRKGSWSLGNDRP
jgi:hypothetical protein